MALGVEKTDAVRLSTRRLSYRYVPVERQRDPACREVVTPVEDLSVIKRRLDGIPHQAVEVARAVESP